MKQVVTKQSSATGVRLDLGKIVAVFELPPKAT
jgi:hypothetical protein